MRYRLLGCLFLGLGLTVSGTAAAASDINGDSCFQAVSEERYDNAFTLCENETEKGDAEAAMHLGYMYLKGKGTVRDWDQARKYLEQAVDQGNLMAYKYLGVLYWNGLGVPRDINKARDLFRQCLKFEPGEDLSCTAQFAETLTFGSNSRQNAMEAAELYSTLLKNRNYEYAYYLAKQQVELQENAAAFKNIEFFLLWSKRYGDLSALRKNITSAQKLENSLRGVIGDQESRDGFNWARDLIYAINHEDLPRELALLGYSADEIPVKIEKIKESDHKKQPENDNQASPAPDKQESGDPAASGK
ncbi:MAG: sel1 repeat family protein [Succinimonas sp.]|nr:sel1 repeat family protein [Succinimonas sp.]